MTRAERRAEIEVIRKLFEGEQKLFGELPASGATKKQIEAQLKKHLSTHYDKNVMVLHAHHSAWPATGRQRSKVHPLKGLRSLLDWGVSVIGATVRLPLQYATIVWIDIKEDRRSKERVATVGMVMEGLAHVKWSANMQDEDFNPHYCHLGVWTLRKPRALANWKVQFVASGLPAEQAGLASRGYRCKIHRATKLGPKKRPLRYFTRLHASKHGRGSARDWDDAWYDAIPCRSERCQIGVLWDEKKCGKQNLWDLLGWDIAINGRGC